VPAARRGAFRLLHGSTFRQRPDVAVELLLLRVCRLRQVAQEHRCSGDVLAGPRKLRGFVGDNGLLDLTVASPRAACSVTSIQLGVAPEVHRRGWRPVLPSLALILTMCLGISQGLRAWVLRGVRIPGLYLDRQLPLHIRHGALSQCRTARGR
jgi:hypothetical protein